MTYRCRYVVINAANYFTKCDEPFESESIRKHLAKYRQISSYCAVHV